MRKAESAEVGWAVLGLRAVCIFLGTTWMAHRLAGGLGDGPAMDGYGRTLVNGLQPDDELVDAGIRTVVLGLGAVAVAVVLGATVAAMIRRGGPLSPIRVGLGLATGPLLALTVPGVALYPLARLVGGRDLAPGGGGVSVAVSLVPDLRFYLFWSVALGLALAPSAAVLFSGHDRDTALFGLDMARSPLAARPEPHRQWRLGVPTMVLLLALASHEALTGTDGIFTTLFRAVSAGNADRAMQVVVLVAAAGAVMALAVDMAGRRSAATGNDVTTESLGPGRAAMPLALTALALVAVAIVGASLDASTTGDDLLAPPRVGGPWLGTDQAGRSLAVLTAAALGPALLAAVVPATVATVLGSVVARGRRILPPAAAAVLDALVDLLWWPAPLLVAVAAWSGTSADLPRLQASVLATTTALLVPPAARLVGRNVSYRTSHRWAVRLRTASFLSAMAFALHLLIGVVGPGGGPERPTLGAMVSDGASVYDDSAWPTLVPVAASVVVSLMLYSLASAVARPAGPSRPRRSRSFTKSVSPPGPAGISVADVDAVEDLRRRPEPVDIIGTDDGPPDESPTVIPTLIEIEVEGAQIIDPDRSGPDPLFAPDAEQLAAEESLAIDLARAGRIDLTEELALDDDDGADFVEPNDDEVLDLPPAPEPTLDHDVDDVHLDQAHLDELEPSPEPERAPGPELEPAPDEFEDAPEDEAFDATKTIELRPADLRRAGILPPEDRPGLTRADGDFDG